MTVKKKKSPQAKLSPYSPGWNAVEVDAENLTSFLNKVNTLPEVLALHTHITPAKIAMNPGLGVSEYYVSRYKVVFFFNPKAFL